MVLLVEGGKCYLQETWGGVRLVEVLFGGWDLSEAGVNMAAGCGDCLQGKSTPCGVIYHTGGP